ncbi:MAG: hypothetical protein J6B90_11855 [Lachnospiraceae bacterium]|nr:hypothetical protein [Lachnospiraceae bacterium]
MSYCVNCGVELDRALQSCPLCQTPVINPRELEKKSGMATFPERKGQVEKVKKKDFGIFIFAMLMAVSITCGLLNLLVFSNSPWALLIIGACLVGWMFVMPAFVTVKLPVYAYLLFDGVAVSIYLYLITYVIGSFSWFTKLALPIVVWVFVLMEIFALCVTKLPTSFLTVPLYLFSAAALLCIGLEILIDYYLHGSVQLVWSAVVLTVCAIIDMALIMLLSIKRLRNAVRRRLHF